MMIRTYVNYLLLLAFTSIVSVSFATEDHKDHNNEAHTETHDAHAAPDFDPVEMIMHHIGDANEFQLIDMNGKYIDLTKELKITNIIITNV